MEQFIDTILMYLTNPFYIAFLIMIFLCYISYKQIVGKAGEFHVKKALKKLPENDYLVLNDLMVESNGLTHQIDHVIISKYGIFVIETKQYNGYITGSEYDKKWIQNKKYYVNNPIHQNYGHVKSLENILNLSNDFFIPIVCFPGNVVLKINTRSLVLRLYQLNDTILSFNQVKINNIQEIYDKLISLNIVKKKLRKKHNKYVKELKKSQKYDKRLCPLCGGFLVERIGKYGKFIGCSNYPKCNFTKKS